MMAAPRFCTVEMKSPCSHSWSVMTSVTGLPPMRGVGEVRELGGRVVAPDGQVGHGGDRGPGLAGQLGLGPVLVEAGHGEPPVGGNLGRIGAGDQAVGVAGVADDQDADVGRGVLGDGPALGLEDAAVDTEQVAALHTRLAGHRADQQGPRGAVEGGLEVGGGHDVGQQGEGAVVDLHDHAVEDAEGRLDLEQAQDDGLVRPEQLARRDAEQEGVADLAGGAGDGDVEGGFRSHGATLCGRGRPLKSKHGSSCGGICSPLTAASPDGGPGPGSDGASQRALH